MTEIERRPKRISQFSVTRDEEKMDVFDVERLMATRAIEPATEAMMIRFYSHH